MTFPIINWLIGKISNYLVLHEGCAIISNKATAEGQELIIQDAFGFRHNIEIKTITRVNTDTSVSLKERGLYGS